MGLVVDTSALVDLGRAASPNERWASLVGTLRRSGETIPANDLCVAATALTLGWNVLVGYRDEPHFRRVPGLGVEVLPS